MSNMTREQIESKWESMTSAERDKWIYTDVIGGDPALFEWDYAKGRRCYSSDISAAWEVVIKMKGNNWSFVLSDNLFSDRWEASFYWDPNATMIEAIAETAPIAICKSSLLAVMGL